MIKNSELRCGKAGQPFWTILAVVLLGLVFVIGIIIGHFGITRGHEEDYCSTSSWNHIIDKVDTGRLKENLRILVSQPHVAGEARDEELVSLIRNRWREDGLDEIKEYSYEVLLSHPNPHKPNKVHIVDYHNKTIFNVSLKEEEKRKGEFKNIIQAFNAYSPQGTVQGKLVFVNYGRKEDFNWLNSKSISVKGHICLARYGKIFRGNQVLNAKEAGAKGILFYSDPGDVALLGTKTENVFPNTIFLPPTGIQRGSVYMGSGDPLTPSWPSIKGALRIEQNIADLPEIPSQPIGYKDAQELLRMLGGTPVPHEWGSELKPYNTGPGFKPLANRAKDVCLEVYNTLKTFTVKNIIGKIEGSLEPDRYVLLGNHRDAWGFGAADPSSGTAQLLETVHIFGELKKQGWKPRRSILFASWAAEEYGIIGSQEWVEEMGNVIAARGVALVNTDTCVSGPDLQISSSPVLYDMALNVMKKVSAPLNKTNNLYAEWYNLNRFEGKQDWELISSPGAGTDEAPFSFYVGIPSVDIWFRSKAVKMYNISIYPAYHTAYDTLHLMERFVDPTYKIHRACSQLAINMVLEFAESHILPFNLRHLADGIKRAFSPVKEINATLSAHVNLYELSAAIDTFTKATYLWQEKLEAETKERCVSLLRARILNDQMMQVERAFILPEGLPGAPYNRHVVFSPSSFDAYEGGGFPGILDLAYKLKHSKDGTVKKDLVGMLRKHVSDVLVHIVEATHVLSSF